VKRFIAVVMLICVKVAVDGEKLIYPAGPVAAVEKSRCVEGKLGVKGKLDVGSTRGDLIKLGRPSPLRDLWHSPCRSKPTAQRDKTKKLTPHRTLHNKRWGLF
jgi:hypothetical protein